MCYMKYVPDFKDLVQKKKVVLVPHLFKAYCMFNIEAQPLRIMDTCFSQSDLHLPPLKS